MTTTTITIVHFEREGRTGWCGDVLVPTTTRGDDVTCRRCLHRMELAARPADAPHVPGPPRVMPHGTWKLDEAGVGRDAIIRDRAGEDPSDGPRWSSLDKAAEQCAPVLDDGVPIRSSFRDEMPVQNSSSSGGRWSGREDVLAFRRALDGAFAAPVVIRGQALSVERCRLILEWRLCGRIDPKDLAQHTVTKEAAISLERAPVEVRVGADGVGVNVYDGNARVAAVELSRALGVPLTEKTIELVEVGPSMIVWRARATVQRSRRGALLRVPVTSGQLAAELREMGIAITDHEVGMIAQAGMRAAAEALVQAGILRPPRRRARPRVKNEEGETMPKAPNGYDKDTWPEIAAVVGLHEDTCRKLAKRVNDPLPVSDYFGRIVAKQAELEAWMERQVKSKAPASGAA